MAAARSGPRSSCKKWRARSNVDGPFGMRQVLLHALGEFDREHFVLGRPQQQHRRGGEFGSRRSIAIMSCQPRSFSRMRDGARPGEHHVVGIGFVENVMIAARLVARQAAAAGGGRPVCESTLCRFMKNWPTSGACQVVQGLGEAWNLLMSR